MSPNVANDKYALLKVLEGEEVVYKGVDLYPEDNSADPLPGIKIAWAGMVIELKDDLAMDIADDEIGEVGLGKIKNLHTHDVEVRFDLEKLEVSEESLEYRYVPEDW